MFDEIIQLFDKALDHKDNEITVTDLSEEKSLLKLIKCNNPDSIEILIKCFLNRFSNWRKYWDKRELGTLEDDDIEQIKSRFTSSTIAGNKRNITWIFPESILKIYRYHSWDSLTPAIWAFWWTTQAWEDFFEIINDWSNNLFLWRDARSWYSWNIEEAIKQKIFELSDKRRTKDISYVDQLDISEEENRQISSKIINMDEAKAVLVLWDEDETTEGNLKLNQDYINYLIKKLTESKRSWSNVTIEKLKSIRGSWFKTKVVIFSVKDYKTKVDEYIWDWKRTFIDSL